MSKSASGDNIRLKLAMDLHKNGDLQGAEAVYKQVIVNEPSNYLALANIGLIHYKKGQWQESARNLQDALRIDPSNAAMQYNLAVAFQQQGKLEEAIASYQQVLALQPNYPEALSNLGVAFKKQGQLEKAIAVYQQAVVLKPNYPEAYNNLGFALQQQGRLAEAIAAYQQAFSLRPNFHEAYFNCGAAHYLQGKLEEAIALYQQALLLCPDYPEAHSNLGVALKEQGKLEEAITAYQQALILRPNYPDAHYNLGFALQAQDKLEEAIVSCRQALALQPHYPDAYNVLGLAFHGQGKLEEAVDSYQQALALQPDFPHAHHNLGLALHGQGKLEEAIAAYQHALALRPDFPAVHLSMALSLLLAGDFATGWNKYEWRCEVKPEAFKIPPFERWNGAMGGDHELILVEEQGLGDIIQFIRYGSLLKQSFPTVSIVVQEKLCKLIEMTGIYDKVYSSPLTGTDVNPGAKWIPVMSVPGMLGLTNTSPLEHDFYIKVDSDKVKQWQEKIHTSSELVIGLNWQGNPKIEKNDFKGRSLGLCEYAPLASIPGVRFVSLQKGYGSEQLETCEFLDKFVECQAEINQTWDFVETAAIIQNCDLIITSDTSIAHLASAIGRPTWILLKRVPDWRWGLEGEACAWYPSARLFRQVQDGTWPEVIERVRIELTKLVSADFQTA